MLTALLAIALALRSDTLPVPAQKDTLMFSEPIGAILRGWTADHPRAFCVTRWLQDGGYLVLATMTEATEAANAGETVCGTLPVWMQDSSCALDAIDRELFATVVRPWIAKQCTVDSFQMYRPQRPGRST